MQHDITFEELEKNLVDLNQPKLIPEEVLEYLFKWKKEQGTIPTGVSYIPDKGWYIISPALIGEEIIHHFPDKSVQAI